MLYYLGIADLPSKKAHSIQEMRMCEAFSRAGEKVVYLHRHVWGEDGGKVGWDDIAAYYDLDSRFDIRTFRSLHGRTGRFTKIGTMSWVGPMTAYVFGQILRGKLSGDDLIYGREFYPLYFLSELLHVLPAKRRPSIVFEQHEPVSKRFLDRFYRRVDGIVCITEKLADYVIANHPIERDRIVVAPDGVDLAPYEGWTQASSRDDLDLPADRDIVMYTGHLYEGKGTETLVRAAEGLDATVYIVGGYQEDIQRVKRECGQPENVVFTGFVDPADIPVYQVAADVLVAPYTEESRPWVSPLKLFEYMAAGRPVVASDREVLKEVLVDGENAVLFEKGNVEALREAIERVLGDDGFAEELAERARQDVEQYTWERRAERILLFIGE